METGAARILVVEDDHDLMRLMVPILESAGSAVVQAYGGEDALCRMRIQWDQIASAASQVGCDGFVPKPFNGPKLLAEIAKHVPLPGRMRAAARSRAPADTPPRGAHFAVALERRKAL